MNTQKVYIPFDITNVSTIKKFYRSIITLEREVYLTLDLDTDRLFISNTTKVEGNKIIVAFATQTEDYIKRNNMTRREFSRDFKFQITHKGVFTC